MVVEDVRELAVDHPHVVRLQARPANVEGRGEVSLTALVRQSLRMRPDRLVVGEVRGAEVRELLTALNTGHEGGCGTLHANTSADAVARFEALGALAGLGPAAVHAQLLSAVRVVVHVRRSAHRRYVDTVGLLARDERGAPTVVPALSAATGGMRRDRAWAALAALLQVDDGDAPMTLAVALLAGAAVLVWPGARSAHLVWPRDEASASPGADRTGTGLPGWRRTGPRGWPAWRRRRRTADDSVDLLALVEAVLPALQAGLTPGAALAARRGRHRGRQAAPGRPRLLAQPPRGPQRRRACRSARSGRRPRRPGSRESCGCWRRPGRSPRTSAPRWPRPCAPPPGLLRARLRAERRVAGAVAGARATMNVLTALPLGGPFLALALGVGPSELYGSSPLTGGCLAAGGVLVLGGRSWVARMVRAVTRGPVLS